MTRCTHCEKTILFGGVTTPDGPFCSDRCVGQHRALTRGFCHSCLEATTHELPGRLYRVNGIGTGWGWFSRDACPTCGSVVRRKWFHFGVPLIPMEDYRVLVTRTKHGLGSHTESYLARRLRRPQVVPPPPAQA